MPPVVEMSAKFAEPIVGSGACVSDEFPAERLDARQQKADIESVHDAVVVDPTLQRRSSLHLTVLLLRTRTPGCCSFPGACSVRQRMHPGRDNGDMNRRRALVARQEAQEARRMRPRNA